MTREQKQLLKQIRDARRQNRTLDEDRLVRRLRETTHESGTSGFTENDKQLLGSEWRMQQFAKTQA